MSLGEQPLAYRCLALTGSFETDTAPPGCFGAVSGDFDGQGLSFGALQWNLGQGTLQPILQEMRQRHPEILKEIFSVSYDELEAMLLAQRQDQLQWARSIQTPRRKLIREPWRSRFRNFGLRQECQAIQEKHAARLYRSATKLTQTYELATERAVALMFDIKVQNGGIPAAVKARIQEDFAQLGDAGEVERLRVIANRRAEASNPQWIEDVRARKLTIANGQGAVHGRHYDLAEQFGIGLTPLPVDS